MSRHNSAEAVETRNACKLCTPLGASLAFKGIANSVPLLHGSQGCSTYIRRYLISHYKEPIDIASSNFSEQSAVFGGGANLKLALENVTRQYEPDIVCIATTCLSETIGDDVPMFLKEYQAGREKKDDDPLLVHVSTPAYRGTHMDGFHEAVRAVVEAGVTEKFEVERRLNVFPGFFSCADLRLFKEIFNDVGIPFTLLPDYSETLEGPLWSEYRRIPEGGTTVSDIHKMGGASASLDFTPTLAPGKSAAQYLEDRFGVKRYNLSPPMGVRGTDRFFDTLKAVLDVDMPEKYKMERGRLIDAYVDGHKYTSMLKAVVYGEEDLVLGMVSFLAEIGVIPILCASGGKSGKLGEKIREIYPDMEKYGTVVMDDADFIDIAERAEALCPDFLLGSSKGYFIARKLNVPLIRVGFPIHDRVGGQRILHVGYRGAQSLFDAIVNSVMAHKQDTSDVGYSYM